jgi:hypothetical protein
MGGKKRKKPVSTPQSPKVPAGARRAGKLEPITAREAIGEGTFRGGVDRGPKGKFISKLDRGRMPSFTKHEKLVGWWLEQRFGAENVASQVHIRPHGRSDNLIVDYVVRNPDTGKLEYYDAKTTDKASKHGQNLKYDALAENGGTVRSSKDNLPDWLEPEQELEPGGKVEKIRKDNRDIAKIKEEIRSTEKQKKSERKSGKKNDKGTSDKGRQNRNKGPKSKSSDPTQGSGGQSKSKGGTKQKLKNAKGAIKKGAKFVKSGAGRLAKFRLSFRGNLILDLAKAVLFSVLEGKLDKVNQEGIARHYTKEVYEKQIDPAVQVALKSASEWSKSKKMQHLRRYVPHSYYVYMERQAEDWRDGVVGFVRGFSFVEVYHGLEPISGQGEHFQDWTRAKKQLEIGKRRDTDEPEVFRYIYRQHLLVWDPHVYQQSRNLKVIRSKSTRLMAKARESALQGLLLPNEQLPILASEMKIIALLNDYEFLAAHRELRNSKLKSFKNVDTSFLEQTMLAGEKTVRRAEKMKQQQKTLLIMYLNANPFTKTRKRIKAKEAEKLLQKQPQFHRPAGASGTWIL